MTQTEQTFSFRQRLKTFIVVMLPVLITNIAIMSVHMSDTMMTGHVNSVELAGVSVAGNIYMPLFVTCLGIVSGLSPVIAHLYGNGNSAEIRRVVRQSVYWALLLGLTGSLIIYFGVPPLLDRLDLEPRVWAVALAYSRVMMLCLPVSMLMVSMREFMNALGCTRITMLITSLTAPLNILFNYIFIFGWGPVEAMGGVGAAYGTLAAFCTGFVIHALTVRWMTPFADYRIFDSVPRPQPGEWPKALKIGLPIGLAMLSETSIFGAMGLFIATYGTLIVGASQAAFSVTSMLYAIPMACSIALTILVGFELGAGRPDDAVSYTRIGQRVSLLAAVLLIGSVMPLRHEVATLFTTEPELLELIAGFVTYAALMNAADALNAPLQGALRGYKDVKPVLVLSIISFWVVGLPLGWILAEIAGQGAYGYWQGVITGLFVGFALLAVRIKKVRAKYGE
ncbi:MAG: MATE family efflux transporter [Selenomonadaceae bacterium]|nr:MATE family efflux transporter [Selenomonadaceae bacterium]